MNTVTIDGMSRLECALAMTLRALDSLVQKGFLSGGRFRVAPKGLEKCAELDAAGFAFNDGEIEDCMAMLKAGAKA